jgi:hypothetical protein
LKARYCRLLDQHRWDEWRELFTEDFRFENALTGFSAHGRDGFVERIRTRRNRSRTAHHAHLPELTMKGTDAATGIWSLEDYVEDVAEDGKRTAFRGYGYYYEEYVRRDGRWLIASSRLERIRVDKLDPDTGMMV